MNAPGLDGQNSTMLYSTPCDLSFGCDIELIYQIKIFLLRKYEKKKHCRHASDFGAMSKERSEKPTDCPQWSR